MSYSEFAARPHSKKMNLVEIDTPLNSVWINIQPGIFGALITPDPLTDTDDYGNVAYWGDQDDIQNELFYNIGSLNVQGELYALGTDFNNVVATEKSYFYDTGTTYIYEHNTDGNPPEVYITNAPGAILGFTDQIDKTVNNEFGGVYYFPSVEGIPNLTKKKDTLSYGIIQFKGGSISLLNLNGELDDFAQRDIYGQPIRVRSTFEGLPYSESLIIYSARIDDFVHTISRININIIDIRKLFSRKLPINTLSTDIYPSMDEALDGTPIPLIFGPVTKTAAYKTAAGAWIFADTTLISIDSGITVYKEDGTIYSHTGTGTDGTFTGADTDENLTVSCSQSTVTNGLDVISFILAEYENYAFTAANYDLTEWNEEKAGVKDFGQWYGKENIQSSSDIIEQVCTDNNGVFDVLADGRVTFRKLDLNGIPVAEIFLDEELTPPPAVYEAAEYLSSIKVEYLKNWATDKFQLYTNLDFQTEVYGRYRRFHERPLKTALTTKADVVQLTNEIMERAKFIYPKITVITKTQYIELRILDNVLYTHQRVNGKIMIPLSRYEVLGTVFNMTDNKISIIIRQIAEDDTIYAIIDGGGPEDSFDFYDGGSPANRPTQIIEGRLIT